MIDTLFTCYGEVNIADNADIYVNPIWPLAVGGPMVDLPVRSLLGYLAAVCRHGGGASESDCTRVDRSAAYAALGCQERRVAAGPQRSVKFSFCLRHWCFSSTAHHGCIPLVPGIVGRCHEQAIEKALIFVLVPLLETLSCAVLIFSKTAAYGHFGLKTQTSWKQLTFRELTQFPTRHNVLAA